MSRGGRTTRHKLYPNSISERSERRRKIASPQTTAHVFWRVRSNGMARTIRLPILYVRFSHVKGKYPRSTQGNELSFHSLLQFLHAEHEGIRVQGVCEGVVRDQILSRVSESCGIYRWVEKVTYEQFSAARYHWICSGFRRAAAHTLSAKMSYVFSNESSSGFKSFKPNVTVVTIEYASLLVWV